MTFAPRLERSVKDGELWASGLSRAGPGESAGIQHSLVPEVSVADRWVGRASVRLGQARLTRGVRIFSPGRSHPGAG